MKEDFATILSRIETGRPICFVRLNDGEAKALENPNCTISRKAQSVDEELSGELANVALFRADDYWIGVPCPTCKPDCNETVMKYVATQYSYLTYAVLLINSNWNRTVLNLFNAVGDRPVWIVSGQDQDWSGMKLNIRRNIQVPSRNAWQNRHEIISEYNKIPSGAVVLLSCGPLSRVLAYYWFSKRRDCTFLDIGSCFDPWTRNIKYRYQKIVDGGNESPYCETCNVKGKR